MTDQPKAADPITWDDMRALYSRLEATLPPLIVTFIGEATWEKLLDRADEQTRAVLESMKGNGSIVVSPYIPTENTIYQWNRGENDFLQQNQ